MIDWHVPLGTILIFLANVVTVVGLYYGLKADNAALKADLALAILGVRADMKTDDSAVKTEVTTLVTKVEKAVTELAHRVNTLETGQDEWTKTLRQRTHDLSEQLNILVLKVDRLERPAQHVS